MSAGSLFDPESRSGPNYKILAIGLIALLVLAGTGYSLYLYTKPVPRSADDILAEEIRNSTVMMLDYASFSGEEFRHQILGKGRLERYSKVNDEAFFTFPDASEQEFSDFVAKYFYDPAKIDFGKQQDGEIKLGDYELRISPAAAHFFRTNLANIRIEPKQNLVFPYQNVTYTLSLAEMLNFSNNSQTYGGKLIARVPERRDGPTFVFANHAIVVAKPSEPSLKRLADDLLKDVGPDREARIQRLVDFVSSEIAYNYTEAVGRRETLKRASETLMTRNGDCSNKTILLASLLEQIGEEYILLYCPQHITVAIPQGNFANENKLDFTWNQKPWLIAETTSPGFQIGKSLVTEPNRLTTVNYVQDPKLSDVIFDASSYEVLKFF